MELKNVIPIYKKRVKTCNIKKIIINIYTQFWCYKHAAKYLKDLYLTHFRNYFKESCYYEQVTSRHGCPRSYRKIAYKSSHQKGSLKKDFVKFIGKHLCQSLF